MDLAKIDEIGQNIPHFSDIFESKKCLTCKLNTTIRTNNQQFIPFTSYA